MSDRTQTLSVELEREEIEALLRRSDADGWKLGAAEGKLHNVLSQPEHQGDGHRDPWLDDLREVIEKACEAVSRGDEPGAIAAYIWSNVQAHLPSAQLPTPVRELRKLIWALSFRPERSRPVWRNKHTGTEITVLDLFVDDQGGFQGGCRRFVVATNAPPPPGPPAPPPVHRRGMDLGAFIEHWEPTGRYVSPSDSQGDQERCGDDLGLGFECDRPRGHEGPCRGPQRPVGRRVKDGIIEALEEELPMLLVDPFQFVGAPENEEPVESWQTRAILHFLGTHTPDCNPAPTQVKPKVRKFCEQHGERDQVGIFCNAPGGIGLSCGKELRIEQPEGGDEEDWPDLHEELGKWVDRLDEGYGLELTPEDGPLLERIRRYVPATSQDSSGLRTAYEKARDQLDEAADKRPRLEDLASLLRSAGSAETRENVATELDEIGDVLGKLPERAIGDDSHFDRLEDRANKAEAERDERLKVPDWHDAEEVERLATEYAEWSSDKPFPARHPKNQEHWRKIARVLLTARVDGFLRDRAETALEELLAALETAEKLAAGGEDQEANVNRVLTAATKKARGSLAREKAAKLKEER